jgi:hypothetical protein
VSRPARAMFVLVLVAGVSACGSSGSAESKSAVTRPAKTVPAPEPTTATTVAVNPVTFDQGACRAFASFAEIIEAGGEDGPDAAGQVGGMIVQAQSAESVVSGQMTGSKLLSDLKALEQLAESSQWKPTSTESSTAAFAAVSTDCRAFPTN